MADRYWRGNSGTWDASTTTNWSTSSGGGGGASAPTTSDNAIFDASSGTGTVTLSGSPACANMDASLSTMLTFTGTGTLACAGNLTLKASLTVSGWTGTVTVSGTGSQTLTFASNTMAFSLTINSSGGSYTLQDNFSTAAAKTLTLTLGTFDANGKNVTAGLFASNNTNTRAITFGNGTWTITGNAGTVWQCNDTTNLTITQGNPVVLNYSGATGTRQIANGFAGGTEARTADFNVTAGTDIIGIAQGTRVRSINFTGFAGTLTPVAASWIVYGNLTISSGMTLTASAIILTFSATSGTKTITTNNVTLDVPVTFNGVGGTWQLVDDLTMGATRTLTLTNGSFDANNRNVTIGLFSSSNSNTRSILMGTGTWNLISTSTATVWDCATSTNFTVTPSTSTIKISGSTTNVRTFNGGGKTYGNIWITNATSGGEVDFAGSNTFINFKQVDTTAQTIKFTSGTTTTVSSWTVYGQSGTLLTINTITAAGHTIAKAGGGFIFSDFVSISHSTISPSTAGYIGPNSTNGGSNVGWSFTTGGLGGFF